MKNNIQMLLGMLGIAQRESVGRDAGPVLELDQCWPVRRGGWVGGRCFGFPLGVERLSYGSSRFPLLTVSKNGIEDGEQLTHACGEDELGWPTGGAHPLIHGPDDRVSAGSDEVAFEEVECAD